MKLTIKQLVYGSMRQFGAACSLFILVALAPAAFAQEPAQELDRAAATAPSPVVPQQVRYAGKLAVRAGQTVAAEFRIYGTQEGGEPLWIETQQFPIAADGSYSVLLGSASNAGLPQSVFAGGAARWLGVSVERGQEQERVLLSSVPYAMKSADAESLAGHGASDFVTQEQLAALTAQGEHPAIPVPSFTPLTSGTITGSGTGTGTGGNLAVFTGANTIGNSNIMQVGNNIGINETTPGALLDVGGTATVRGTLDLPSLGTATVTAGFNSQSLELGSSAWSTTTAGPVVQNFFFENLAIGNNTASPAAKLDLLFASGAGNPAATGFSIGSNGLVNFAAGQMFPGASTITNVTTASPLTGGGSSGALTLALSMPTLEATLSGIYPQLTAGNTFKANQTIDGSLTTTVAVNTSALNTTTASIEGLTTAIGGINVGNNVQMHQINVATTTTPYNSPFFQFIGSAYNSTTAAPQNETFSWQTVVTGNNTASPSAYLQLLSGSGTTQSATGLRINPNGTINFVPAQTFPGGGGTGTITGVTTSSPLTGSGTSGSVALGLNTSALETTLNSVYAQLGTGNDFSNYIQANEIHGPGFAAVYGVGTNGSTGTVGSSDTGYGVQGTSRSGWGVVGGITSPAAGSAGVLGSTGAGFSGTYSTEAGTQIAGVWGDTTGSTIPNEAAGVLGTADNAEGGIFFNNSQYPTVYADNLYNVDGMSSAGISGNAVGDAGIGVAGSGITGVWGTSNSTTANVGVGVQGTLYSASTQGTAFPFGAGVWGDTGVTGGVAVEGTTDQGYSGVFTNSSANFGTLAATNNDTSSTTSTVFVAFGPEEGCTINVSGVLTCSGTISTNVKVADTGRQVQTYAVQSAENWFEDAGTVQLVHGAAHVDLEPIFGGTVNTGVEYHFFLTPDGDCKGLYVSQKSAGGFYVRELGGGTSSIAFEYRIMAKRTGYETARLVDVTDELKKQVDMRPKRISPGTGRPKMLAPVRPQMLPGGPVRQVPHRPMPTPKARPVAITAGTRPAGAK